MSINENISLIFICSIPRFLTFSFLSHNLHTIRDPLPSKKQRSKEWHLQDSSSSQGTLNSPFAVIANWTIQCHSRRGSAKKTIEAIADRTHTYIRIFISCVHYKISAKNANANAAKANSALCIYRSRYSNEMQRKRIEPGWVCRKLLKWNLKSK